MTNLVFKSAAENKMSITQYMLYVILLLLLLLLLLSLFNELLFRENMPCYKYTIVNLKFASPYIIILFK